MNAAIAEYLFEMPEPVEDGPLSVAQEFKRFVELTHKHRALLTQQQISVILGVSRQRVAELVKTGRLPLLEVAGGKYIPWDAFEAFVKTGLMKVGRPSKFSIAKAAFDIS
jgi:hypothetical protein